MGMLLHRHYVENMAKGATAKKVVAPEPKPVKERPVVKEEPKTAKVSRQEIMRMNVATVRAYATEQGIEGANAMSGAELKRLLVNKMFEESE